MDTPIPEKRFVILEDNPLHERILQSQLQTLYPGSKVEWAHNIGEARQMVAAGRVDLLLVDVHLEKEHCKDLLEVLPRDARGFPILVVTGDRSEETLALTFNLGVDDYMTKPIDPDVFESKVRSLMSGRYVSPLGFFGRDFGLAPAKLNVPLELVVASETEFLLRSAVLLAHGAQLSVNLGEREDLKIPLRVFHNEKETMGPAYLCRCSVLRDLMSDREKTLLRRRLSGLVQQSPHPVSH